MPRLYLLVMLNALKKTNRKVLICNANIHLKQECMKNVLVPKYVTTKISNTSSATKFTKRKLKNVLKRQKPRCLHIKNKSLNQKRYQIHMSAATE